jgi:hypothetical protein
VQLVAGFWIPDEKATLRRSFVVDFGAPAVVSGGVDTLADRKAR